MTTWNPTDKGSTVVLSNSNLTATGVYQNNSIKSTDTKTSGKWFCEIIVDTSNYHFIGIGTSNLPMTGTPSKSPDFFGYYYDGRKFNNNVGSNYGSTYGTNDVIGVLVDFDRGTLTFYKNGISQGVAYDNIKSLSSFDVIVTSGTLSGTMQVTANFGATPFKFLPNIKDLPFGVKSYDGTQKLSPENKSLILHDGEYKKFIPKVNSQPKDTNLVPIMTSNVTPKGKVTANAESDPAWGAFDDGTKARSFWFSIDSNNPDNQWLQYEFEKSQVVNKVSLKSDIISSGNCGIKAFSILGTNDGINYDVLFSSVHPNNTNEVSYSFLNTNSYKIYRIKGNSYNSNGQMLIVSFKMFGDEIPATPAYWSKVSPALPSSTQFQEKGMDNLSPLLDRREEELKTLPMTNKSEILGVGEIGKVFNKTIDLKKYFDIRSIRTEVK
ncbi:SPRY domain-containing protein [Lysinibacillus xylanilyticus]|uniref:SPRY domain-containing protein n=1 Tax=Lysinibacillus xylanilyticus TaxID=582475 RepID=UPI00381D0433